MRIVEAIADAEVFDAAGAPAYRIAAGERYAVYDSEAGFGQRQGALRVLGTLDGVLPRYGGQPLGGDRLLLPFIGRLGDAVVTGSCLHALREAHPGIRVDIAAGQRALRVFAMLPTVGELLAYPMPAGRLKQYQYHLSFESIAAVPGGNARSCADVFSACLRTPRPTRPPTVTIPQDSVARRRLGDSGRPRVAIHAGRSGSLRSLLPDLMSELARRGATLGASAYLIGERASPDGFRSAGADLRDYRGRTPEPADLAALLWQMDVLVTGDSFPMHLAGAMGLTTVAIFTSTDAILARDYSGVVGVPSQASCSPCRVADGRCPLGHSECVAHRDKSVSPESIAAVVAESLAVRRARPETAGSAR